MTTMICPVCRYECIGEVTVVLSCTTYTGYIHSWSWTPGRREVPPQVGEDRYVKHFEQDIRPHAPFTIHGCVSSKGVPNESEEERYDHRETNIQEEVARITEVLEAHDTGYWATGGEYASVIAAEWLKQCFRAEDVDAWLCAGCFRAEVARRMAEFGIEPHQAAVSMDGGPDSVGYKVANGDLSVAEAKAIIDEV